MQASTGDHQARKHSARDTQAHMHARRGPSGMQARTHAECRGLSGMQACTHAACRGLSGMQQRTHVACRRPSGMQPRTHAAYRGVVWHATTHACSMWGVV
eukprot:365609-Chlamydomonas_euryale.AAC.7